MSSMSELKGKLAELRELVWGEDIASPTVPEYVEHHQSIQKILHFMDKDVAEEQKTGTQQMQYVIETLVEEVNQVHDVDCQCDYMDADMVADINDTIAALGIDAKVQISDMEDE